MLMDLLVTSSAAAADDAMERIARRSAPGQCAANRIRGSANSGHVASGRSSFVGNRKRRSQRRRRTSLADSFRAAWCQEFPVCDVPSLQIP